MRVVLPCLLAGIGLLASASTAGAADRQGAQAEKGEVIVRFKPGVSGAERSQIRRDHHATVDDVLPIPRVQVLDLEPGASVDRAVASLERDPRVEYAERNLRVRAASNDPFFGNLWGLENLGGTGALADADIDGPEAWAADQAAAPVIVAVADTGVVFDHPDLVSRLVPGHDYVDDDDVAADLDFEAVAQQASHGTHVAGTIAAERDNAIGVAGVADQVQIMPLRVLDGWGRGSIDDIATAFTDAGNQNVPVVNASLSVVAEASDVETLRLAIAGAADTLFVVAAGNRSSNVDAGVPTADYPCAFDLPNVLCVAASDQQDRLASFSNYGSTSVDLAAPGVSTWSTAGEHAFEFREDFEDDLSGWTSSSTAGASRWEDSNAPGEFSPWDDGNTGVAISPTPYDASSETILTRDQPIDLTGLHGCQVLFDLRMDVDQDAGDEFAVEVAADPLGAWTKIYSRTADTPDDDFLTVGADLRDATETYNFDDEPVYVRFRFTTDAVGGAPPADGVFFDFVDVWCVTPTYWALKGTSMAAPHVSGAAALVLGNDPALTTAGLKERLISTGDPSACWTGRTVSGRRLNAARALGVVVAAGPTATTCGATAAPQGDPPDEPEPAPAAPPPAPPPPSPPPAGTDSGTTAPAVDDDPPTVTASAARRYRAATLLRRGLRARIRCDEACRLRADVLVGRRTAKRYGIKGRRFGSRYVLVGRSRAGLSRAGSKTVTTKISRRARRGLRRVRRARLVLRVVARDEHGNDRVTRRSLTVRR